MANWLSTLGSVGHFLADVARSLRDFRVWTGLTVEQMRRIGVNSVPIALFIAAFTGIVLALQASYTLSGAVPLYFVGTAVGKSLLVELGPVLTGLVLAGRVGANIAAELGTMKVTEQVDALETLAYDPHSYLVVPRVIAASVMFPVIVAMASALGIVTGWLTAINMLEAFYLRVLQGDQDVLPGQGHLVRTGQVHLVRFRHSPSRVHYGLERSWRCRGRGSGNNKSRCLRSRHDPGTGCPMGHDSVMSGGFIY